MKYELAWRPVKRSDGRCGDIALVVMKKVGDEWEYAGPGDVSALLEMLGGRDKMDYPASWTD